MAIINLPMNLRELSHELRTPLTGILGMTYCLSQEPLTKEQQDFVANIYKSGNQLLTIVEMLLSAKRLS